MPLKIPFYLAGRSIALNPAAAAAAKSLQSCPTLCNPIDGSPPGSAAPGILQARTLERVATAFSNAVNPSCSNKDLPMLRLHRATALDRSQSVTSTAHLERKGGHKVAPL